ncbi:MAG: TonB-dependent receptor domain-containing protein [Parvicellaceae bacterium]
MKIKVAILINFFTIIGIHSQTGKISGLLFNANNEKLAFSSISVLEINTTNPFTIYANENGYFLTPNIKYGSYQITYFSYGYEKKIDTLNLNAKLINLAITLKTISYDLNEVVIKNKDYKNFQTRKLKAIEGVMITQGKKTEAIDVENTDANKATNLSRQIYGKIPGLNIWESDGAGIQIGLGGRGLNPSRNSNFNTRQNGYDISADALGYPESYYTPPSEAIEEIQLIRGAASLQFGPQFGGLINFKLKEANPNKPLELIARHTIGSFGLNNSFVSLGGTKSRWKYFGYCNYKFGNDFRPNSEFEAIHGHFNIKRQLNERTSVGFEFTKMYYLAHQPGGLTDNTFLSNPYSSVRSRNWFQVDWNLAALNIDYEINSNTKLNSRTFGLIASRNALGYLDNISRIDPYDIGDTAAFRNLISGDFINIGNETRLVHLYEPFELPWAFVVGVRAYRGQNNSIQGDGNTQTGPDFYFVENTDNMDSSYSVESNYQFPSFNFSAFAEHIFNISNQLSITPGIRYEYISTAANGRYREQQKDLAGNIFFDTVYSVTRNQNRGFLISGIGLNYKLKNDIEAYLNFSQNYRSINFADMQITNPNFKIDPILQDERGFNADLGIRGKVDNKLYFDASIFTLFYNNRIGTTLQVDTNLFRPFQYRTNVSQSRTFGIETMVEADWIKIFFKNSSNKKLSTFVNFSYNDAKYINSDEPAFENKYVELVPPVVLRTGCTFGINKFSISFQYSYTDEHFSDATNATIATPNAVVGVIPSYNTMDISGKYSYKKIQIEMGINNLTNVSYFTRRASGYPGPGILPSAPRNFYIGLQIKL